MTSDSKPVCENANDDWLVLDHEDGGRLAVIGWCERHAGMILGAANLLLWSAVAMGFHFG